MCIRDSATPDSIPWRWRNFAYKSYLGFQKVDNHILEPYLPAELFYNLLLSAQKPE